MNFLQDCEQRVTIDGISTKFLKINRGVPQGIVLGSILFSVMVIDIKPTDLKNEFCKFAGNVHVEVPGYKYNDTGTAEVKNIKLWSERNQMALNMDKTYEMIVREKRLTTVPSCIPYIKW